MTNATAGLVFESSIERTMLFRVLAAAAVIGPGVVLAVAVGYFWTREAEVAYMMIAASVLDFFMTMFIAITLRYVEVTFDGRVVRFGSGVFKKSIPIGQIFSAEAARPAGADTGGARAVKLFTASGTYLLTCRNADTFVEIIKSYAAAEGATT
ncbi:MAG: hypothetical protein PVH29_00550 [Candidatus Zixiibacteriota bacterium]|jgi:hypothetical protein